MMAFRKYWAEGWSGLDVGHRGLGNSYTQVKTLKSAVVEIRTQRKFSKNVLICCQFCNISLSWANLHQFPESSYINPHLRYVILQNILDVSKNHVILNL